MKNLDRYKERCRTLTPLTLTFPLHEIFLMFVSYNIDFGILVLRQRYDYGYVSTRSIEIMRVI